MKEKRENQGRTWVYVSFLNTRAQLDRPERTGLRWTAIASVDPISLAISSMRLLSGLMGQGLECSGQFIQGSRRAHTAPDYDGSRMHNGMSGDSGASIQNSAGSSQVAEKDVR